MVKNSKFLNPNARKFIKIWFVSVRPGRVRLERHTIAIHLRKIVKVNHSIQSIFVKYTVWQYIWFHYTDSVYTDFLNGGVTHTHTHVAINRICHVDKIEIDITATTKIYWAMQLWFFCVFGLLPPNLYNRWFHWIGPVQLKIDFMLHFLLIRCRILFRWGQVKTRFGYCKHFTYGTLRFTLVP